MQTIQYSRKTVVVDNEVFLICNAAHNAHFYRSAAKALRRDGFATQARRMAAHARRCERPIVEYADSLIAKGVA